MTFQEACSIAYGPNWQKHGATICAGGGGIGSVGPTVYQGGPIDNRSIPHNVEPPIARAEHLQAQLRQLRQDRDEYRRLLLVTEQLIADYEVLAGVCPF